MPAKKQQKKVLTLKMFSSCSALLYIIAKIILRLLNQQRGTVLIITEGI
jgi:hypothetical protein